MTAAFASHPPPPTLAFTEVVLYSAFMKKTDDYADSATKTAKQNAQVPNYYTVSTARLVVFSLISAGFYLIYWFYRNFKIMQEFDKKDPADKKLATTTLSILAAIFLGFTSYALFVDVRRSMQKVDKDRKVGAGGAAWGVFFLDSMGFAFFPVMVVQDHMNHIKKKAFGEERVEEKYTAGEIVMVMIGGLYMLLAIFMVMASVAIITWAILDNGNQLVQQEEKTNELSEKYEKCDDGLASSYELIESGDEEKMATYSQNFYECETIRIDLENAQKEYEELGGSYD